MKGILHIKLFEYLIETDGAFGHVELRSFLLKNFKNVETERSRIEMSRFLKLLVSENYIEYVNKPTTTGIELYIENGGFIPSDKISAIVRIKPKAIELYNAHIVNRKNLNGVNKTIIISLIAVSASIFGLFYPKNQAIEKNEFIIKVYDSIIKSNLYLKDENDQLRLKKEGLEQKYKDTLQTASDI
ncbi:hypothetical protein FF125_02170 [Aureibaculum algae]|uniref:Uncharacterized protein n=1 Tax=Aureibaculum algae TaxID=2584122 RepID=A0A5B7TPG2_9FLAO|nr:hypothetical protein [Aureibaculum algae]QCX37301.1 hypothetical protein FF125_02170 [Aureibaculum algae]